MFRQFVASGILALSLSVGPVVAQTAKPARDTITVGFATESTTMDPSRAAAGADYYFISQMFEQLTKTDAEGKRRNWLAESVSIESNDGKPVIDVVLRKGVKFHNGDPLTADDFEFTFNRMRDPKISRIAHLQAAVSKFEIIDPHHFKLHFSEGDATYLTDNLRLWALPKKYIEKVGDDGFATNPVGTGPWKFVSRSVKTEIRFEAFDQYWNKEHRPTVKNLVIKLSPEDLTRLAAFKTHAVDIIESVPVASVAELKAMPGVRMATLHTPNFLFVQLATQIPSSPFNDLRVRKAAAHAIDMDAIIKNVLFGQGERYVQLGPDDFGYDQELKGYNYDPKKAKQLLSEAGYPRGFDTPCYNITTPREANLKELGEAVFAYFSASGIRCRVQGVEYNAWLNLIRRWPEGTTQKAMDGAAMSMYGHSGNDASNAFAATLHTFEAARGFGSSSNTSIPELDLMIEEQKREMNPEKRLPMVRKIAQVKNEQLLAGIPIYRPLFSIAWHDDVDFKPWPMPGYWRGMQEVGFK